MSVMKQQGWLDDLVKFLNYTFDSEPKTNKRAFNRLFDSKGPFVAGLDLSRAGEPEKQLQQKLIQGLSLIVEASDEQTFHFHLSVLVQKINRLNLKTEYMVVSGNQYLYPKDHLPKARWQKAHRIANPARGQLGPGRRILKSKSGKAIVARLPWLRGDTPAEKLYEIILRCLLDGSFSRLRRCPNLECRQFHIPKDLKRTFCSNSKCKDAFHNKRRLEGGYSKKRQAKKKRQMKQEERRMEEQKMVREFANFLKMAASGEFKAGSEMALFIKRKIDWRTVNKWIKDMKDGKSVKQIWEGLSELVGDQLRDQLEHLK